MWFPTKFHSKSFLSPEIIKNFVLGLLHVGRSDWYYPWATDKKDPDAEEEQIGESLLHVEKCNLTLKFDTKVIKIASKLVFFMKFLQKSKTYNFTKNLIFRLVRSTAVTSAPRRTSTLANPCFKLKKNLTPNWSKSRPKTYFLNFFRKFLREIVVKSFFFTKCYNVKLA